MMNPKYNTVGGTFDGPDLVTLTEALLDKVPYAQETPTKIAHNYKDVSIADDWRVKMLVPELDGFAVTWGSNQRIDRDSKAVSADLSFLPFSPNEILAFVAPLPFKVAVMSPLDAHCWMDDYFSPAIHAQHALLSWGVIIKGVAHKQRMVSDRWIGYGPWLVSRGPENTTLIQFHELDVDAKASMPQAQAAHDWMVRGYLRPDHSFEHDIEGIYTDEDKLLRIVVTDRDVTERELLDACVARRDGQADLERPIENVAYVFMDEPTALAHLDALWLRGLECRAMRGGQEVRLDVDHSVVRPRGWWA